MRNSEQIFIFDTPIRDFFTKISKYPALGFANTVDGNVLAANDRTIEYFSMDNQIENNLRELVSKAEAKEIISNNILIINKGSPQLFYEVGLGKQCLCIKTSINDSSNHCIGVGGVAFYFHQIALKDIISVVNKLVFISPITNELKYTYIAKAQKFNILTSREKECTYYLPRSMTHKEIGKALGIGHRTVQTHIEHIKKKLCCYSRSDIVSKLFETK